MQGFGTIVVSDNCTINYEIPNAFTVELEIISPSSMTKYDKDKIVEVLTPNFSLKVGESIKLSYGNKESTFFIRNIEHVSKNRYRFFSTKITKARHFIMPCLGKTKDFWHYDTWLHNCYIGPDTNDIVLVYRFGKNPKYLEFENSLRQYPNYFMTSEPTYDLTCFHFRVPKEHEEDIKLFIEGKYSNFSEKLKTKILNFHKFEPFGKTWKILYKDSKLREQMELDFGVVIHKDLDLFDIPNIKEEILML